MPLKRSPRLLFLRLLSQYATVRYKQSNSEKELPVIKQKFYNQHNEEFNRYFEHIYTIPDIIPIPSNVNSS